jgi:hypothetical protein
VLLCALALTGGYLVGSQFDNGHIKLHRVLAPLIASPSLIG